jgi:hypothetical protein
MVDFNKETTVTTAPSDLIKVMILERWNNVIEAFERYQVEHNKGLNAGDSYIRSRLYSLVNILYGGLKREMSAEVLKEVVFKIQKGKYSDLVDISNMLATYLDDKRLTRIDTRKQYDTTIVENDNEENNL